MRTFTQVGRRVLPHSTAVGKVLLAWHDEAHLRRVVDRLGLPERTPQTLTSVAALVAGLAAVREPGWAVDDEKQEPGVRCIAVPVGPGSDAVAAFSVPAPASRLAAGQPEVVAALRRFAEQLTGRLAVTAP